MQVRLSRTSSSERKQRPLQPSSIRPTATGHMLPGELSIDRSAALEASPETSDRPDSQGVPQGHVAGLDWAASPSPSATLRREAVPVVGDQSTSAGGRFKERWPQHRGHSGGGPRAQWGQWCTRGNPSRQRSRGSEAGDVRRQDAEGLFTGARVAPGITP